MWLCISLNRVEKTKNKEKFKLHLQFWQWIQQDLKSKIICRFHVFYSIVFNDFSQTFFSEAFKLISFTLFSLHSCLLSHFPAVLKLTSAITFFQVLPSPVFFLLFFLLFTFEWEDFFSALSGLRQD